MRESQLRREHRFDDEEIEPESTLQGVPGKRNTAYERYAMFVPHAAALQRMMAPASASASTPAPFSLPSRNRPRFGARDPVQRKLAEASHVVQRKAAEAGHPVQCKEVDEPALDPFDIQITASQGIAGPARRLPHLGRIQESFGRHDVSGVEAHVGGAATAAAERMGALAYATGNQVAFREAPDLHTAAHEAAHVVQQRSGVQLAGGVGQAGDPYEEHADRVANAVVRGERAESLLDEAARGARPRTAIQCRPQPGAGSAGQEYTRRDNRQLVELLLREAAETAKTALEQPERGNGADSDRLEAACIETANRLESAIHAMSVPGGKSARPQLLFGAANLAYGWAGRLIETVAEHSKGSAGSPQLRASLRELSEVLEPSGWQRPASPEAAGARMTTAEQSGHSPCLDSGEATELVKLSLATAAHRIRAITSTRGSGDEARDQRIMTDTAGWADTHLADALRVARAQLSTSGQRRLLAPDIADASQAIGELHAWARASQVDPDERFTRLFEHEDELLEMVGLEPERRYVESHGDGNAIARRLVRGGDHESSGYSSKDGALSAIGKLLDDVFEAQGHGLGTARDAIEEPKTHHDPTSLEQLAESAAAIALSATAGFLGNLAASRISGYLTRHQGLSGASALSPGWQASVDGAKDGVKELYKQSLQFGLSDAKSPKGPIGGRPADTSVQGALRTPKAIFLNLQREAIRSASSKAAEGLGKAHEQLAHQDLTTLSAVAAALEELVEQAADAQARHTLVEWMNFKARWHASSHLEKGSRRDANLSHLDRRQLLTSPEGFLTVWARVEGALTDRSVACQRMKLGGLDDEESVARWFKQSGMVIGEPRMNVMVRVLSNNSASARDVILWRRPDRRVVDIQHCSVAGLAWLKAFAAGKAYSRSSFAAGFPWSNAEEIANLNRIYDDFHAQRAAETIVGAILTEPLSELET